MIPFLDLRAAYLEFREEIDDAVARVLDSGLYILGSEVEAFEAAWAGFCEARHAVGVANGLDALTLALRALGVGRGDEVIVPSNTYIATWLGVSAVGAKPIPVEPDPATYNLDPARVAAAITRKTKVILPVHLYGQPADLDPILALARDAGVAVVEDAAQAHGAKYKGRRIGAHGDIVCWSFYPTKNLGAMGDAGAITTDRADLADKVTLLRNYGSRAKYVNEIPGSNSRLDPLQAAILRVKLRHLDIWTERRRSIAAVYGAELGEAGLARPFVPDWAEPVWHLYVVRVAKRASVQRALGDAGIATLIHYPIPPHLQAAYSSLGYGAADLPVASRLADEVLSLPLGPHLAATEARYVAGKIRDLCM